MLLYIDENYKCDEWWDSCKKVIKQIHDKEAAGTVESEVESWNRERTKRPEEPSRRCAYLVDSMLNTLVTNSRGTQPRRAYLALGVISHELGQLLRISHDLYELIKSREELQRRFQARSNCAFGPNIQR